MKRAAESLPPPDPDFLERRSLLHRRGDIVEGRLEAGAEALHRGDGGDGDQGGDQAIFDGGRALAAFDQLANELHYPVSLVPRPCGSPHFLAARAWFIGRLS